MTKKSMVKRRHTLLPATVLAFMVTHCSGFIALLRPGGCVAGYRKHAAFHKMEDRPNPILQNMPNNIGEIGDDDANPIEETTAVANGQDDLVDESRTSFDAPPNAAFQENSTLVEGIEEPSLTKKIFIGIFLVILEFSLIAMLEGASNEQ